jgi:hypothetical protein
MGFLQCDKMGMSGRKTLYAPHCSIQCRATVLINSRRKETMNENPLALLLDDNLMSAMRVQAQLERSGYRVLTQRSLEDCAG